MDKQPQHTDPNEEDVTRECLIAISYGLPSEFGEPAETPPKNTEPEKVTEPQARDGDEKYRSNLISISYLPSPDMGVRPLSPRPLNA